MGRCVGWDVCHVWCLANFTLFLVRSMGSSTMPPAPFLVSIVFNCSFRLPRLWPAWEEYLFSFAKWDTGTVGWCIFFPISPLLIGCAIMQACQLQCCPRCLLCNPSSAPMAQWPFQMSANDWMLWVLLTHDIIKACLNIYITWFVTLGRQWTNMLNTQLPAYTPPAIVRPYAFPDPLPQACPPIPGINPLVHPPLPATAVDPNSLQMILTSSFASLQRLNLGRNPMARLWRLGVTQVRGLLWNLLFCYNSAETLCGKRYWIFLRRLHLLTYTTRTQTTQMAVELPDLWHWPRWW